MDRTAQFLSLSGEYFNTLILGRGAPAPLEKRPLPSQTIQILTALPTEKPLLQQGVSTSMTA